MLHSGRVREELARQREALLRYEARHGDTLAHYRAALAGLRARYPSAERLEEAQRAWLAQRDESATLGARPTADYDAWLATDARYPALPFGAQFASHEQSRAWAERLRGVTTFAVDGSQLPPWRDASTPVALVQAGLYENPHQPPLPYVKDIVVELLTPEELTGEEQDTPDARSDDDLGYSSRYTQLRRFELEARTMVARMEHHQRRRAEVTARGETPPLVVAFFDGSLIVSFAMRAPALYRERYVAASQRLLEASEQCGVPLLGYIDTSYARDIGAMLRALAEGEPPTGEPLPADARGVSDALLWRGALGWGQRTPAFLSARYDLARIGHNAEVGFVYFQAALDRPPARIEFPRWLLDAGLLDRVLDVVRGEVIVGSGYPYPIEAADAVAVISAPDRAQFYTLFQEFAEHEGLRLSFSRKALSKSRRRV